MASGGEAPVAPLRKPEPRQLLRLELKQAQRARIAKIASDWEAYRSSVDSQVAELQSSLRKGGRTADGLRADLQDFAATSREYDATRERYWREALAVLTPSQRKEAEK